MTNLSGEAVRSTRSVDLDHAHPLTGFCAWRTDCCGQVQPDDDADRRRPLPSFIALAPSASWRSLVEQRMKAAPTSRCDRGRPAWAWWARVHGRRRPRARGRRGRSSTRSTELDTRGDGRRRGCRTLRSSRGFEPIFDFLYLGGVRALAARRPGATRWSHHQGTGFKME